MSTTIDPNLQGYESLGADINKRPTGTVDENKQGVVSEKLGELDLSMKDEDIIKLTDKWEKDWKESAKKQEWEKQCEENRKYWLGQQFDTPKADKTRPMVDNLIFEAVETYLPQATRRNPEPIVSLHSSELSEDGNNDPKKLQYVDKVKRNLIDLADENALRLKLKGGARQWSINLLGVAKFGWDLDKNIPIVRIIRPQKILLDPDATINEDGYSGDRIGEIRKMTASKIIAVIGDDDKSAKAKKVVTDLVKNDTGTEVQFTEWWTPEYVCWRLGKELIFKKKNPHWNYDKTEPVESVDSYGNATQTNEEVAGINHFTTPKMPYEFLAVFNLGDQPMDNTSLISQNLSNQDLINKRNKQIDKNADKMNGGAVVSLERSGLTQAQARGVVDAVRKGGAVLIPSGSPQEAVYFPQIPPLPGDVYNQLIDTRARLRDIFGVKGSSQAGLEGEDTVRGKIISRGLDTDRIGGGVTEYLEQFGDKIYNWLYQLLLVYDDNFQFVAGGRPPRIKVSVKEGSLLPKDSLSIANQALDLARLNRISTLDLYKRLEFPNPEEMAANVWLETNAPQILYKDNPLIQEALGLQAQAAAEKEQADATKEAEKMQMKGAMDMEKEKMKTEGGLSTEFMRSILSGKEMPSG